MVIRFLEFMGYFILTLPGSLIVFWFGFGFLVATDDLTRRVNFRVWLFLPLFIVSGVFSSERMRAVLLGVPYKSNPCYCCGAETQRGTCRECSAFASKMDPTKCLNHAPPWWDTDTFTEEHTARAAEPDPDPGASS
jgi:hypothetical protein